MKCIKSGVLLLVAAGLLAACAEERAPINRVQPYALPKSFFVGEDFQNVDDDPEFWSQTTVVDVGYGAKQDGLFTSSWAQPMSRLKWQITEDMLIGRASYERITGSDGKGVATGLETQDGNIVVAFAIVSQFDIVNSYNSTTGEKLNVLEENNYDRPWYEREYIRVDFSRNLQSDSYDFDTLSLMGVYGSIIYEPLAYYVSDPNDEEAPYFDMEQNYFDITTKVFAKPGLIDLSDLGWGIDQFPACYLDADFRGGSFPSGNCNPVELTLRQSFRRVEDNDFEPKEMDGWRFQAFGLFDWTERRGFDRQYGMTDNMLRRFQSTFQLYEKAHFYGTDDDGDGVADHYDPEAEEPGTVPVACYTDETPAGADVHRDEDGNGTEDECELVTQITGVGGSRCDEFNQKCTLPYRLRTIKPMAWYYTNESDSRFFRPTEMAANQWDAALRTAFVTAQYTECMATTLAGSTNPDDLDAAREDCYRDYKVYYRQQDSNDDLMFLALEMDDCRHGLTFPDYGEVGSEDREGQCADMVEARGEAIGAEEGVIVQAQMPETIVFCHSPVEFADPAACAPEDERLPEGTTAASCQTARATNDVELLEACQAARNVRLGDLRYHVANVVETPQTPSPWGIMTSAVDPVDGQTIASCVNVWSYVNDFWAQRVVDWMRFANGELSAADVTEGTNVKNWTEAAAAASRNGVFQTMTRKEARGRIAQALGAPVDELYSKVDGKVKLELPSHAEVVAQKFAHDMTGVLADSQVAGEMSAIYRARMKAVAGSALESELMNRQMQQLGGVEGLPLTDGILDMVSPLRGGNAGLQREIKRLKMNAMAERGMCELEMTDTPVSIVALGNIMEEKFGFEFNAEDSQEVQFARAQRIADYIAKWAHVNVIVHEMGHAVGHRHNFVSSSDAFNFRPQYWQLRTNNGYTTSSCIDLSADGENCVGQRYLDPVTDNEDANLIWMWEQSSVMDYAGETTQDMLNLGAWDFATTRMGYGDSVAVYPTEYITASSGQGQGVMTKLDNFGGIIGFQYDLSPGNTIHYTQLQSAYKLIEDCEDISADAAVVEDLYKPASWDESVDGEWHPVLDGKIVKVGGQYSRCHQQKVDYVRWTDLRAPTDAEMPKYSDGSPAYMRALGADPSIGWVLDDFGRIRVPYGFATDRWADIGNAAVYRHDNGADSYEIFNFFATQQEMFHIFDNYRRGISTFTLSGATARLMDRYLGKMRDGAKGLALQKNWIGIIGGQVGISAGSYWNYAAINFWPDSLLASTMVFDHFTRNAQRPMIGPHKMPIMPGQDNVLRADDSDSFWDYDAATNVVIPNGGYGTDPALGGGFSMLSAGGKLPHNMLDDNQGEYAADFTINAGSYYDKMWMAMMMSESADNFISDSRGDFINKRYRAVSLADFMPDGYRRWIGNNLTNDDFIKGARVAADDEGIPIVSEDGYLAGGIGWTKWWGDEVESCFPAEGTNVCSAYAAGGSQIDMNEAPDYVLAVDPQLSWETQKFLITWTYVYLPENQQHFWRDQMRMYSWPFLVDDVDLEGRIVFYNPTGGVYVANAYGREEIYGKTVEKGISARVLQYANELLSKAYETTPVDYDGDGTTDWYEPFLDPITNTYQVLYDAELSNLNATGTALVHPADCNSANNEGCTCDLNRFCMELEEYISVLDWMAAWSGFADYDTEDWNDTIGVYH